MEHGKPLPESAEIAGASIEFFRSKEYGAAKKIAAAHPASAFSGETAVLLAHSALAEVICINPRGLGGSSPATVTSFEAMVEDIEHIRTSLGLGPWIFWGMSGGGWLAQLYARLFPEALAGLIIESACCCFRERLADATCALSPFFPPWHDALEARGLFVAGSHSELSSASDTEWCDVENVGQVWRRRGGPALLVSPLPIDAEMKPAMPLMWNFDARAWLPRVRIPTLVLAGAADPVVPVARVRQVHELIPGSQFAVIPEGGHVPSAQSNPDAIARVRDFIDYCAGLRSTH